MAYFIVASTVSNTFPHIRIPTQSDFQKSFSPLSPPLPDIPSPLPVLLPIDRHTSPHPAPQCSLCWSRHTSHTPRCFLIGPLQQSVLPLPVTAHPDAPPAPSGTLHCWFFPPWLSMLHLSLPPPRALCPLPVSLPYTAIPMLPSSQPCSWAGI